MRAVNQALGRVIRHKDDYGMIFLLDVRYELDRRVSYLLPEWSKKSIKNYTNFQTLMEITTTFFKQM